MTLDAPMFPLRHWHVAAVVFLFVAGMFARYEALRWNTPYVHDNLLYGNAAESLAKRGDLKIATTDPAYQLLPMHYYSVKEYGGEYLDHNPLWSVLAAPLVMTLGVDGFRATELLSYAAGFALLVLLYMIGARMGPRSLGLFTLALGACSYLLIDFSGNGSFYVFQAALYLLFVYVAVWKQNRLQPVYLGVIAGAGMLLVQQSASLIAAYAVYLLLFEGKGIAHACRTFALFLAPVVLLYAPWGLRNYFFLGSFFPPADMYYVWDKLGIPRVALGDIERHAVTVSSYVRLLITELTNWFPKNLYYIQRQLFVLAPVAYVLAGLLAVEMFFARVSERMRREELPGVALMFLVLGFHIAISAAWPVPKFRYFVAMVPLVITLGGFYLWRFVTVPALRTAVVSSCIFATAALSLLTYFGISSRTYYYGGVLTTDPFGGTWEVSYIAQYKPSPRDPKL